MECKKTVWAVTLLMASLLLLNIGCKEAPKKAEKASNEVTEEKATDDELIPDVMAPGFTLNTLEGESVSLSDYKGQTVVIHIATTWCPFCNAEAPHLEKLSQDYKDKNVVVLLIDVKEPKELVREKLKDKFNLSFPVLLDEDGSVAASYAPEGVLPDLARDEVMLASNLVIDAEGKIQFMSLLDSKNFDAELIQLKKRLDEIL